MRERINVYYKYSFGSGGVYMSGCHLPDPNEGPYRFIRCDFHPGVWDDLKKNYTTSEFEDCDY